MVFLGVGRFLMSEVHGFHTSEKAHLFPVQARGSLDLPRYPLANTSLSHTLTLCPDGTCKIARAGQCGSSKEATQVLAFEIQGYLPHKKPPPPS